MEFFYWQPYGYIEYAVIDEKVVSIVYIHIDKEYRRMGYGIKMMRKFAELMRKRRVWNIELENMLERSNKFYDKMGFKYVDKNDCTMKIKTYMLCKKKFTKNI